MILRRYFSSASPPEFSASKRAQEIPVLRRSVMQILDQREERGLGPVGNLVADGGPAGGALRSLKFGAHARGAKGLFDCRFVLREKFFWR